MSDETKNAYQVIIADLEEQVRQDRAVIVARNERIEEARTTIAALRNRLAAIARAESTDTLALFPLPPVQAQPERARRGDVKQTVLRAIRENPGATSTTIADLVESTLDTPSADKRKLVHSTISYLAKVGLARRDGDRLHAVEKDASGVPGGDDENMAF